jgi:UDP-N-acetylglucosamine 3-dehydrogenase
MCLIIHWLWAIPAKLLAWLIRAGAEKNNMTKKLRCAVIGAGQMGQHHARTYADIAELVAVADVDFEKATQLTKRFGGKAYVDYKQMLKEQQLDAVSVVVPPRHHYAVAKETLKIGLPTLLEKPIASTLSQAEKLIALAKEHDTPLLVGHVERFNPALQKLRALIDDGRLGKIITLAATRVGVAPPLTPQSDVSLDLGIHDVDAILYLVGSNPTSTYISKQKISINQRVDAATIVLSFGKATAVINVNWITPLKIRSLRVTGTKGYAELDYIKQELLVYDRPSGLVPKDYTQLTQMADNLQKEVHVQKTEPLRSELLFFLKQKHWSKDLHNRGKDAIQALKILLQ